MVDYSVTRTTQQSADKRWPFYNAVDGRIIIVSPRNILHRQGIKECLFILREALRYFPVKIVWSYIEPFSRNTRINDRRHIITTAELCNATATINKKATHKHANCDMQLKHGKLPRNEYDGLSLMWLKIDTGYTWPSAGVIRKYGGGSRPDWWYYSAARGRFVSRSN